MTDKEKIMGKKELKTNAMRILDRYKIPYEYQTYECDEFVDGITIADQAGLPHDRVYKTLVTTGKSGIHYVFVIPIASELDLKKAARSAGEKSLEMLPVKELTSVTGYVRGGCTAIGMKKAFPTIINETARYLDYMYVSGGRLGMQLKLDPGDLKRAAGAEYADVIF
nr:Cys-tRNA(Pro) deacylase [Faecalicatena contorta]